MNRKTVVIKKYGNRRLYDTTHSRYINQDEVAEMVRAGLEVQVVDAATGEDLTRLVLTQIIVEDAKEPDSALPLDILRQMVVACGKATQENTMKYTKAVLDMYQNAYRAMAPPLNPFEFIQMPAVPVERSSESKDHRKNDESVEAGELKQRVEELESLVARLGDRKIRPKRKGKWRKAR
jgi:polyhydroxyalkanoate synthesis repressor PhaR